MKLRSLTRWEAKRGSNYVDRQGEAIKDNLLETTDLFTPLHGIFRKGLPTKWTSRTMKAGKRKNGLHEIQGYTWPLRLPGVQSGKQQEVTHPTTEPDFLQGAHSWGRQKQTQKSIRIMRILGPLCKRLYAKWKNTGELDPPAVRRKPAVSEFSRPYANEVKKGRDKH